MYTEDLTMWSLYTQLATSDVNEYVSEITWQ